MKPACARVCASFSPFGVLRSGGGIRRDAHLNTSVEMVACCGLVIQPALRDAHLEGEIGKALLDDAVLGEHREVNAKCLPR